MRCFARMRDKLWAHRNPGKLPQLAPFENKISSQFGEDGVIERIFQTVPLRSSFFVEFGIGPNGADPDYKRGLEGNCVQLARKGWSGLFMDAGEHPARFGVKNEFITPANDNEVFRRHNVPDDVDLVSIDVDGQDWWIWEALESRPSVIVIEYNGHLGIGESVSVPLDPEFRWDGSDHYGASLLALCKLGERKGYTLVFANGVNAFFVQTASLPNAVEFEYRSLYRPAQNHHRDPLSRAFVTI